MACVDLDSLIGKSLDNRFELKKLIGQGGYGAVFDAIQTSMHRRCAVKVLSFQTDDPKQIARFELEARVTCQLSHPNTIVVYEYGRDEELGVFFIAMEFLGGQSLTELVNSRTLSIEEVLFILEQIADSLDDAHTYELVHRDIKPHNIMVVKRGDNELCVKVIDFGIAKTAEKGLDLTQTDTIIGTPEYMSTEQVLNKTLTGKSDQYALAVTAYYLLTGRTLFNCETALQTAVAHASEIPPAISTITDRFMGAEKFDAALLKALSKDPDHRFDSCRAFVDTLVKNRPEANPESAEYPLVSMGSKTPNLSEKSFEKAVAKTAIAAVEDIEKASAKAFIEQPTADSLNFIAESKNNTSRTFLFFGLIVLVAIFSGFIVFGPTSNSKLADNMDAKSQSENAVLNTTIPPIEKASLPIKVEESPTRTEKSEVSKTVSQTLDTIKKETPKKKEPVKKTKKKAAKITVKITATPWGDIYVDGKKRSSRARYTAKLSEGMHTFSLKQKGVSKATKRLEVKAGESLRVRLSAD